MDGRRLGRAERRQQTREGLLDAAARIFGERGFDRASVEDVAEEAGFTKGAVYSNFASKTELMAALIGRRIEEQAVQAAQALAGLSLEDGLRALDELPSETNEAMRDWYLLVVEFFRAAMRDERTREALAEQYERARTISGAMLAEKYAEAGVEPPMPARDLAIVVEALGLGVCFQALIDPSGVSRALQGTAMRRLLEPGPPARPPAAPKPQGQPAEEPAQPGESPVN